MRIRSLTLLIWHDNDSVTTRIAFGAFIASCAGSARIACGACGARVALGAVISRSARGASSTRCAGNDDRRAGGAGLTCWTCRAGNNHNRCGGRWSNRGLFASGQAKHCDQCRQQ